MKISVSLPEEDLEFVDEYMAQSSSSSRSSVIHHAIALLRTASLEDAYAVAWGEWEADADAGLWDATAADGITDASR